MRKTQLFRASAAVTAAFALAACEQATEPAPRESFAPAAAITLPTAVDDDAGRLFVCKDSPDPAATFDFTYTVVDDTDIVAEIGSPFSVGAGQCVEVLNVDNSSTTGVSADFTVTETDPDNLFLGADVYKFNPAVDADWTLIGANQANGVTSFVSNDRGVLIVFRNDELPPPPPGDDGCTPGYWKNHTASWGPTGYSPGQAANTVFTFPAGLSALGTKTLLATLDGGGGPGVTGGATILLRAAVAALLNAAHPGVAYPRTTAEIIADVNAALASGNRGTMLALAEELDEDNNLGCPLN